MLFKIERLFIFILICGILSVYSFKIESVPLIKANLSDQATECNITHFEFRDSKYYSKNDIVNRTFNKINEKKNFLPNQTWKINNSLSYTIYQAVPIFFNITPQQSAEFMTKSSYFLHNANVLTVLNFKWLQTKDNETKTGNGLAEGNSKILIGFEINATSGTPQENLLYYQPFDMNKLVLTDIDKNTTQQEKKDVQRLLDINENNQTTVRYLLIQYVNSVLKPSINSCVQEQNQRTGEHFSYKWISQSVGQFVLNFTRKPKLYYPDSTGIEYGYELTIDNYTRGKCSPPIPTNPVNLTEYPGGQSFVSLTFYQNAINAAMEKGFLNTVLNKTIWPRFAYYKAQMLQDIINNTEKFDPNSPIYGQCIGNPRSTEVTSSGNSYQLKVIVEYNCKIKINEITILDMNLVLYMYLYPNLMNGSFVFIPYIINWTVAYNDVPGYQILRSMKLLDYISDNVSTLKQQYLFGSGFPSFLKFNNPQAWSTNLYIGTRERKGT